MADQPHTEHFDSGVATGRSDEPAREPRPLDRDRAIFDSQPPNPRSIAAAMHAESVTMWNHFWQKAGEDYDFPEREAVEQVQLLLKDLAWGSRS